MSRAINTITAATAADGATNLNIDSGTLFVNTTNNNVGIGTTSPGGKLDVYDASSSILNVLGNSTVQTVISKGSADTTAPILIFRKSRGSVESPAAVATGDQIGNINFQAFGGTNNRGVCRIIANVETYVSDSDIASNLTFLTSSSGGIASTERMRIDSSGNVGIGTTSPAYKLEVNGKLKSSSAGGNLIFNADSGNEWWTGSWNDLVSYQITRRNNSSGNGTSYLTISTSGNVGIGTGLPISSLHLKHATPTSKITLEDSSTNRVGEIGGGSDGTGGLLTFSVGNNGGAITERLRIDSSGNLLVGASAGQSSERLLAQGSSATNPSFIAYSPSATFTGYVARIWADRNTSNSTYNFLSCVRVGSAGDVFIIRDSGNAVNTNNSYGAISDIKLKENIEDAASQWNDIKSIQVRKFSFKNDEEHKRMLGLVAQEVELISPNLVEAVIDRDKDGNDLGTTTKEVKYSVLYMKAVKALQEAMGRIEQLEAKVTALEAA